MIPALIIAALGLAFATPALAETDTATFDVTATVNDSCTVFTADLEFGTYDPSGSALEGTTTITAMCTEGTEYDIGLDTGGNGTNATSTTRAMVDGEGSSYLDYELYTDSSRTSVWGDTVGTDTVNNPSAAGGSNDETVYGEIPGEQFVTAASYSDTINVTITF